MAIYFVAHPNMEIKAKVEAPSTEKARTTFLDYLERNGTIRRADRQYWRLNMVAEKLELPEDAFADLELFYGYDAPVMTAAIPASPRVAPSRRIAEFVPETEMEMGSMPEAMPEAASQPSQPAGQGQGTRIEQVARESPAKQPMSPIARAALGL